MGIFGRIFGTEKAIDDITDKDNGLLVRAGGWVDGLGYTDQEKAENAIKVREWGLTQLEALEPFKIVQRVLAFATMFLWILVAMNVIGAIWYDAIRGCAPDASTCVPVTGTMIEFAVSDYVFWPVVSVMTLYFLGGVLPSRAKRSSAS